MEEQKNSFYIYVVFLKIKSFLYFKNKFEKLKQSFLRLK